MKRSWLRGIREGLCYFWIVSVNDNRDKIKWGEGEIVPYDPKVGCVRWTKKMAEEEVHTKLEKDFYKAFY